MYIYEQFIIYYIVTFIIVKLCPVSELTLTETGHGLQISPENKNFDAITWKGLSVQT